MISVLRKDFINTWLLARDLDAIAERSGDEDVAKLCMLIQENYDYPVDSVLISSDLQVVGHVNIEEPAATNPHGYLAFLRKGVATARGEEIVVETEEVPSETQGQPALILDPAGPTGTVLDVIQRRGFGESSMTFYPIDATAFAGGGTLEISVRVGGASASGRFELCAAVPEQPGFMGPVRTLQRVGRGETATMAFEFEEGALLGLAAAPGDGSVEGDTNAFLATITVRGR